MKNNHSHRGNNKGRVGTWNNHRRNNKEGVGTKDVKQQYGNHLGEQQMKNNHAGEQQHGVAKQAKSPTKDD